MQLPSFEIAGGFKVQGDNKYFNALHLIVYINVPEKLSGIDSVNSLIM